MGLKDIYAATQASTSETARNAQFFSERVLPLVQQLTADINADPDLNVSFSIAGENGGFHEFSDRGNGHRSYWWALEARFTDKQGTDMGKAKLRLAGNFPENTTEGFDLRDLCGRQKAIQSLVGDAARQFAVAESNRRMAAEVSAMNQKLG